MKYDYNKLVQNLFGEAQQCLNNKCYFAAIAMSWAAVDYVIDFELSGGKVVNSKTMQIRRAYKFNPSKIEEKLKKFYLIFPEMKKHNDDILLLYRGLRNPFLHIKVKNVYLNPGFKRNSFKNFFLYFLPV